MEVTDHFSKFGAMVLQDLYLNLSKVFGILPVVLPIDVENAYQSWIAVYQYVYQLFILLK